MLLSALADLQGRRAGRRQRQLPGSDLSAGVVLDDPSLNASRKRAGPLAVGIV